MLKYRVIITSALTILSHDVHTNQRKQTEMSRVTAVTTMCTAVWTTKHL